MIAALALLAYVQPAAAAAPCPPQGQTSAYCSLAAYPHALCNDGSPGIYHIRLSTTGSTSWLFFLEGGGACDDEVSCRNRRMAMKKATSSSSWVANAEGILSARPDSNPDFADGNAVEVHYCSSDFWSGTKKRSAAFLPGNAGTGWNFQGRAIAAATLVDVMKNTHTFPAATRILFSGSSAGGIGIALTYNDLSPMLPADLPKSMAMDAGFTLPIDGFSADAPPTYMLGFSKGLQILASGRALWRGHGDSACVSQKGNVLACYLSGMLVNAGFYGKTPVFVAEAEADTAQLRDDGWSYASPLSPAQQVYLTAFAAAMTDELQAVPARYGVYAPRALTHELFLSDAIFTGVQRFPAPHNHTTPQQALGAWYRAVSPVPRLFGDMPLP